MFVLATRLSTEQVTLIIRAIIQALSYGVPFLLGFLILGNAPKVAPLETHDLLNRVVGQSTSFFASCRWIFKRLFRENRDPMSSRPLLFVLVLSLCYGWFVSISDLGLLGVNSCTVPGLGSSFRDFPASIKSDGDALALVTANMLNGTNPNMVKAYRCDVSLDVDFSPQKSLRVCSEWSNSTYGNSSHFSILNSTDSDVLMPKGYFASDSLDYNGTSELNIYFRGAAGHIVTEPTIQGGIAVLPHDAGVKLIVGVPQLSRNQKVNIPKTLGLEVEMGCMPLGVIGEDDVDFLSGEEYFIPDAVYLPERLYSYWGPEYLQAPLAKGADAIRQIVIPYFDTSTVSSNGFHPSYNGSGSVFSPFTEVIDWAPPGTLMTDAQLADQNSSFLINNTVSTIINCGLEGINSLLNITYPPPSLQSTPTACELYQIRGSFLRNQVPILGHASMICGTASQVNMLSVTLETDGEGALTYNLTRLPSTLNTVTANFFEVLNNVPQTGNIEHLLYDNMWRFTLSDNPAGPTQHYIYQEHAVTSTAFDTFRRGSGNIGVALVQVGSAMLDYNGADIGSIGVLNPQYFTTNLSAREVTKWASGLGASYLLSTVGYNGWAARGSQGFTVMNTGGKVATCYSLQYAAAFIPVVAGALLVVGWGFAMLFTSKISKANKLEELYGGLSPIIEFPYPGKLPSYTYLEWEDHPEPHLKPAVEKMDPSYFELRKLVGHSETEIDG